MNIQTNAIISNQTYKYSYEEFVFEGNKVRIYNSAERGVGKTEIWLWIVLKEIFVYWLMMMKYFFLDMKKIISAYKDIPHADVIIFNLIESNSTSLRKRLRRLYG